SLPAASPVSGLPFPNRLLKVGVGSRPGAGALGWAICAVWPAPPARRLVSIGAEVSLGRDATNTVCPCSLFLGTKYLLSPPSAWTGVDVRPTTRGPAPPPSLIIAANELPESAKNA